MSHRDLSITHGDIAQTFTRKDLLDALKLIPDQPGEAQYPIMIPQSMYDAAKHLGVDVSDYSPYQRFDMIDHRTGRVRRKHLSGKTCNIGPCLPGLNGKCVACSDVD